MHIKTIFIALFILISAHAMHANHTTINIHSDRYPYYQAPTPVYVSAAQPYVPVYYPPTSYSYASYPTHCPTNYYYDDYYWDYYYPTSASTVAKGFAVAGVLALALALIDAIVNHH